MNKFEMPEYRHPDFSQEMFVNAPSVKYEAAEKDGVAPENFHSTSMYPEYFKIDGEWKLAEESRMDSCVVYCEDGHLAVVEARNLKKGDRVITGRTERCEEGIYMHCHGFEEPGAKLDDQFVFRQGRSRETSYARDYDKLFELLKYEKENGGNVVWVMGPAFAFDADARAAMQALIENGYAQGVLAGNALATHDLEGALLHTALAHRALPVPVRYSFPDCDCPRSVPVFHRKGLPHPSLPHADTEVPVTLPYTAHRFPPRMESAHLGIAYRSLDVRYRYWHIHRSRLC